MTVDITLHVRNGCDPFYDGDGLADFRRRAGFPPLRAVGLNVEVNYQACSETTCYRPERVRFRVPVPAADLVYPVLEP